jgi:hypothetical protein
MVIEFTLQSWLSALHENTQRKVTKVMTVLLRHHRFRLYVFKTKNGTGADLDDIVTCAKFGLEPAE